MELIQHIEDWGYPTDYLVARIHGRQVTLFSNWDNLLFSPDIKEHLMPARYGAFISAYADEGIRQCYRRELHWTYHQMNNGLRSIFLPYFIYSELSTLMTGLRLKLNEGSRPDREHLLAYSLLSEQITDALRADTNFPSALQAVEKSLCLSPPLSPVLRELYINEGFKKAEEYLKKTVFTAIFMLSTHRIIKRFFAALVDTVNLRTVYKHIQWEVSSEPAFIEGGNISEDILERLVESRTFEDLFRLFHKHTGMSMEEVDAARFESVLHRYVLQLTTVMKKEGSAIGFILNYLWRCYIEARNLRVLLYGKSIAKTVLKAELVY